MNIKNHQYLWILLGLFTSTSLFAGIPATPPTANNYSLDALIFPNAALESSPVPVIKVLAAPTPKNLITTKNPAPKAVSLVKQPTQTWTLTKQDIELRSGLARWCKQAGWQLDWQVQGTFPIDFEWQVQGTFKEALNYALKASQQSEIPLTATMFNKNKVLRITSIGN